MSVFVKAYEEFAELNKASKIWVAYSGGVDSHVLLHSLQQYLIENSINTNVSAIHVNHGLNKKANEWQQHAIDVCNKLNVPIVCESIHVNVTSSVENSAREKRYEVYSKYLQENDILLMAHHLDDQAETLLFRVLRGTGNRGLQGIPKVRSLAKGTVIRPLLSIAKKQILEYASFFKLSWIEDNTNSESKYSRNYIRNQIFPVVKEKWPDYLRSFARLAENSSQSCEILEEIAKQDLDGVRIESAILPLDSISHLSENRKQNAISYFIQQLGYSQPSRSHFKELQKTFLVKGRSAQHVLQLGDYEIRKYQNNLFFLKKIEHVKMKNRVLPFSAGNIIRINDVSRLVITSEQRNGLLIDKISDFSIRFRKGGEKILSDDGSMHMSLKKMFNQWQVPPWRRDITPLICNRDEIVCIPEYYINPRYLADTHAGLSISWELDDGSTMLV